MDPTPPTQHSHVPPDVPPDIPPSARASVDPGEFSALYAATLNYVWTTVGRLGIKGADREDLVHDIFLTAYRRFETFDRARPANPWLFGIAYRVVLAHKRRHRTTKEIPEQDLDPPDQAPAPVELLSRKERREVLRRSLDQLPLKQRAVVILHDVDGLSGPDIAQTLDVSVNTVYSRLRLGRQTLQQVARRTLQELP